MAETDRRKSQAAPALVLGVLLWVLAGLLATYGGGEGPGVLLIGLLGAALFVIGVVLWVRK